MKEGPPGVGTVNRKEWQQQAHAKLEARTCKWIEEVTRDVQNGRTITDWLGDGTLLCKIANAVHPDLISSIQTDFAGLTPEMRKAQGQVNISKFTRALKRLQNPQLQAYQDWIFEPIDLTESKNIEKVIKCLDTLERNYPIKVLQDPTRQEQVAEQTDMDRMASMATTTSALPIDTINTRMDKRRTDAANNIEIEACAYVENITGSSRDGKPASEWLGDGILLCELANKLRPGSIKVVEMGVGNLDARSLSQQRLNLTNFVQALKDPQRFGLDQMAVFDPIKFQNGDQMQKVCSCLATLKKKYPNAASANTAGGSTNTGADRGTERLAGRCEKGCSIL